MPEQILSFTQKTDKNDQADLTNLAIHEFRLVYSNGGS